MSFILDALKKIEQDKRRSDPTQMEAIAVSRSRFGGRQSLLAMVAIAIGSAVLTAAVVSLLSEPGTGASGTTGVDAPPAPVTADAPTDDASVLTPTERPSTAAVAMHESRARARETERAAPSPPRAPEPEPAFDPDPAPPVVAIGEDADAEVDNDSLQPVRIVGRERALLDGLNIDGPEPDDDDAAEPEPEPEDALPADFPELVLQGTSMIGVDAVAVISDQRVFEGDVIEGARVVRIGEREVELELDGRRFTLRL